MAPVRCGTGVVRARLCRPMQRYQLGNVYTTLRDAIRSQNWPAASAALGQAIGVALPGQPSADAITAAAANLAPQLTYRGFKPAELAMVAGGVKPLVKFEDIPRADAAAFTAPAGDWSVHLGTAYRKDYLLLRSRPCAATDPAALVTVYCGRGDLPAQLRALEGSDREAIARAGALLAIPPCCSAAFAADFERSRQDQDTVNDDACHRVVHSARADQGASWTMNPLADRELLGFYPCSCQCPQALLRAQHVRAALPAEQAALAKQALLRPTLYFRLPFFLTFIGQWDGDALHFTAAQVNGFGHPLARTAQALLAAHLLPWLAEGDALRLHGSTLQLWRGTKEIQKLALPHAGSAVLSRWTDDP